ncbi:DUF2752 domain-containing protein [Planctomycetaceae bacterium SH139]
MDAQSADATPAHVPPAHVPPASSVWLYWFAGASLIVLAASTLRVEPPRGVVVPGIEWRLPETCWSRTMLGVDCLGCGMTRSFIYAAHGQLTLAWQTHRPGTILFFAVVALIPVSLAGCCWRWRRLLVSGQVECGSPPESAPQR